MRSSAQPPHFSARTLQRLDLEEHALRGPAMPARREPAPPPARPQTPAPSTVAAAAAPHRAAPPFGRAFADSIPGARPATAPAPAPAAEPAAFEAPLPSWLQPFAYGLNARFTRTPDYLITGHGTAAEEPEAAETPADAAETATDSGAAATESAADAPRTADGDTNGADGAIADDDGRAGLAAFLSPEDEADAAAEDDIAFAPADAFTAEDAFAPADAFDDEGTTPIAATAEAETEVRPVEPVQPESVRRLGAIIVVDRPLLATAADEQDNLPPAAETQIGEAAATDALAAGGRHAPDELPVWDDPWPYDSYDAEEVIAAAEVPALAEMSAAADPAVAEDGAFAAFAPAGETDGTGDTEAPVLAEDAIPEPVIAEPYFAEPAIAEPYVSGPDILALDPVAEDENVADADLADAAATDATGADDAAGTAGAPAAATAFAAQWTVPAAAVAARFAWETAPAAGDPPAAEPPMPAAAPAAAALPPEPPAPTHAPRGYELPTLDLLDEPPETEPCFELSEEFLEKSSMFLQQTLHDFGVRGEIIDANPGPVVTLYELEPAPGTKSSRVISLSGDISRSMSAVSARVAVVEGRNVIGIELPNPRRETVWLRELLASQDFAASKAKLGLCLGKTIGGEPVIADLARMPHLLVAGTTGSGKSVAINTMILSLLYRHTPEDCRLIMIDPKMLELSVYEGIPHLLTPVVTDPRKAVVALKWAVREMEERYRKMARLGVRNIDGFNARVAEAAATGETVIGTDGEPMELTRLPYIVVIVDEMADLMMVAGKDIEGAIQRLAQMARAAGIHIIMATQRPSVDVITGTIKANFPTRISFQVTSKIDSRTILGEQGAEQLLGQGDMLYMAGGGRIQRVHGPFVSDGEVEKVVAHLKAQGRPDYLEAVVQSDELPVTTPQAASGDGDEEGDEEGYGDDGSDLYEQAVALVFRDRKASTSYVQRRLKIGYNRAASIMERMEREGIVGQANHAGKREIIGTPRGGHHDFD